MQRAIGSDLQKRIAMMFINGNSDFHSGANERERRRMCAIRYLRASKLVVDDSVIYEFYCLYVGSYLK